MGRPWTDFDLSKVGGHSINTLLHRDAGDCNRQINSETFLRKKDAKGKNLLRKDYDRKMITELVKYHNLYWKEITKSISQNEYLFVVQLHSMDPYSPVSSKKRPDLCLVAGEKGQFISEPIYDIVMETFGKSVSINDPFNGQSKEYALLRNFSLPDINAFQLEINKDLFMLGNVLSKEKRQDLEGSLCEIFDKLTRKIKKKI